MAEHKKWLNTFRIGAKAYLDRQYKISETVYPSKKTKRKRGKK